MANTTQTIAWRNGTPTFNPPAGVTTLNPGDTVTVQLTGAPSNGQIDWVKVYGNCVVGGEDQKDLTQVVCEWTRDSPGTCDPYAIAAQSATQVTLTDQEHPQADDKYWFAVGGSPDSWEVDPELINRPGGG